MHGELGGHGMQGLPQCLLTLFYFMYLMAWRIFENKNYVLKLHPLLQYLVQLMFNCKILSDWWSTLHQPASVNLISETTIHSSMLIPLYYDCSICPIFFANFLMKYNTELIKIKNKGLDRL